MYSKSFQFGGAVSTGTVVYNGNPITTDIPYLWTVQDHDFTSGINTGFICNPGTWASTTGVNGCNNNAGFASKCLLSGSCAACDAGKYSRGVSGLSNEQLPECLLRCRTLMCAHRAWRASIQNPRVLQRALRVLLGNI